MNTVTLILCIHNHQPVGNLPDVFEEAYRRAYLPLLEAFERFPDVKFVLHNSGPLLEWYEEHAPEYIERLARLAARGQVEILTGGFYEPILCSVPERDALGQIAKMTDRAEACFGVRPRGMWLAERVWEPHLARTLARAGVEYLPLDDYEFRLAGLADEDLVGYFVTDDQGYSVGVFPISRPLRYSIPFKEPNEVLGHLRALAERVPGACAVFGDDGEKFGVWPTTYRHVYGRGWLDRFLTVLVENNDWLRTATFAEVVEREPPRGRVYLPTASYPEMMEWALPTPARKMYGALRAELAERGVADEWAPFLSGGTWRNFIAKYDESNVMVRKMLRVSGKIAELERGVRLAGLPGGQPNSWHSEASGRDRPLGTGALVEARNELWKGQCNCAYWHGVFGGLYLPHLRSAVYQHLIAAENLVDAGREGRWDSAEVVDHDLDGEKEVLLESQWANVYLAPARGGTIFELDLRRVCWNVIGTMSRYEEAYHEVLKDAATRVERSDAVASIHDGVTAKERGLERLVVADPWPRRAARDLFLSKETEHGDLERARARDMSDFAAGRYAFELARSEGGVGVVMRRTGRVASALVELEKSVWLTSSGDLRVEYVLEADGALDCLFATEWNLAFLTDSPELVYMEDSRRNRIGVRERIAIAGASGLRLTDAIRKQRLSLEWDPSATLWAYPIETVSQSDGGLERVFQGTSLVVAWALPVSAGERRRFTFVFRALDGGGDP